jgi:hypothetical protein
VLAFAIDKHASAIHDAVKHFQGIIAAPVLPVACGTT